MEIFPKNKREIMNKLISWISKSNSKIYKSQNKHIMTILNLLIKLF